MERSVNPALAGEEYLNELGWLDFHARMYDPSIARWHAPDPLAAMYAPHSPYSYCLGNPVNFSDPDGKEVIPVQGGYTYNGADIFGAWAMLMSGMSVGSILSTTQSYLNEIEGNAGGGYTSFTDYVMTTVEGVGTGENGFKIQMYHMYNKSWSPVSRVNWARQIQLKHDYKWVVSINGKELRSSPNYNTFCVNLGKELVEPKRYKNGSFLGTTEGDYVLYDGQWINLMPLSSYFKYVENYNHPKGGIPLPREHFATFQYTHNLVIFAGIKNAAFYGGSGAVLISVIEKSQYTPVGLFFTFIFGQINAYEAMLQRMKKHDDDIDFWMLNN